MGKRCPACRKAVSRDAVVCTNCGYDRRTRSRYVRKADGEGEASPPGPLAYLVSPFSAALALLTFWGFFFYAATQNPAMVAPYRASVLVVGGAAALVMLVEAFRYGVDWDEVFILFSSPEYFFLRGEFEGYTQVVLMTSILAGVGVAFLAAASTTGVGP